MDFEVLKRSHVKRNIIVAVIIILILSAVILTFTKAKYKTTASIPLVNGTINYDLSDLNLIGAYIQEGEEYKQTNEIPTSGYEFNSEKSYCTVNEENINATINFDIETQTLSVVPLTKKGTKCYLYFDKNLSAVETILAQEWGVEAIEAKGVPNFSKTAQADCSGKNNCEETNGMYAAEDDYGTSYYYRGAVYNNWFQFGTNSSGQTLYWRIIRINGNGSIRLIYNGPSTEIIGSGTMISTNTQFSDFESDGAYVGYMYTINQSHGLSNNNNIKKIIDNWYLSNLLEEKDYIDGNTGFCGDRSSVEARAIYYGAYERLVNSKNPSFKCRDSQDLYTTPGSSKGNGALKVTPGNNDSTPTPIGLITADEVAFAGGVYNYNNNSYYLYNNSDYWTISPYNFPGRAATFRITLSGSLLYNGVTYENGVRPVINLRADVQITGSGTTTDPFKLSVE